MAKIKNNEQKIKRFTKIIGKISTKSFPEHTKSAIIGRIRRLQYYIEQNALKKTSYKETFSFTEYNEQLPPLKITMLAIVKKLFRIPSLKIRGILFRNLL